MAPSGSGTKARTVLSEPTSMICLITTDLVFSPRHLFFFSRHRQRYRDNPACGKHCRRLSRSHQCGRIPEVKVGEFNADISYESLGDQGLLPSPTPHDVSDEGSRRGRFGQTSRRSRCPFPPSCFVLTCPQGPDESSLL